ncbi:unnamed protein product [Closterium sp. Naga37s-1]|nr:unnamed protein product [Closterium sp. Naga37s-1]
MAAAAVLPAPTQFKAARAVVAVMEAYRDARVQFVMKVGELAVSPQNAEALLSLGALQLLLPLAQDSMASVRSAATLSLGRLANVLHAWSHHLVQRNVLPSLCKALTSVLPLTLLVLPGAARCCQVLLGAASSVGAAWCCLVLPGAASSGSLAVEKAVRAWLKERRLGRTRMVVALAFLAASSPDAALAVVVAWGGISPLQDLLVEGHAHANLKGAYTWALSQMASHGAPPCTPLHPSQDCVCLSTIARHSEALALQVLDQPGASHLLLCLHDSSAAAAVREVSACRHIRAARPASHGSASVSLPSPGTLNPSPCSSGSEVREVARQGPAAAGWLVGMGGIGPLLDDVSAWRDEGEGEGAGEGKGGGDGEAVTGARSSAQVSGMPGQLSFTPSLVFFVEASIASQPSVHFLSQSLKQKVMCSPTLSLKRTHPPYLLLLSNYRCLTSISSPSPIVSPPFPPPTILSPLQPFYPPYNHFPVVVALGFLAASSPDQTQRWQGWHGAAYPRCAAGPGSDVMGDAHGTLTGACEWALSRGRGTIVGGHTG